MVVKMKYQKIPIEARVRMRLDGSVIPEEVIVSAKSFPITRILKITELRPVGVPCIAPIEFTVVVEGSVKRIYYERSCGNWFSVVQRDENGVCTVV